MAILLVCMFAADAQQATEQAEGQGASPQSTTSEQLGPPLLSYEEIIRLNNEASPPSPLRDKLTRLLTTPFVSDRATSTGVAL